MQIHRPSESGYAHLVFVVVVLLVVREPVRADLLDAAKVHILVVADTDDPLIGKHVQYDKETVVAAVEAAIPEHRRTLKVLTGEQATPPNVMHYYRELRNGTADTLLFYYAGHGSVSEEPGQLLTMRSANLSRRTLVKEIKAKHARLNVILTDCCSVHSKISAFYSHESDYDPLTIRYLLFRHQGTVDLTAADIGKPAYGSDSGGVFTNSLFGLLRQSPEKFDADGDGVPSWKDFWDKVKRNAALNSEPLLAARDRKLTNANSEASQVQVPYAFSEIARPLGNFIPKPESRFGIDVQTATDGGALVTHVYENSPAAWFGIEIGDVLTKVMHVEIKTEQDFTAVLANQKERNAFPLRCEFRKESGNRKISIPIRLSY